MERMEEVMGVCKRVRLLLLDFCMPQHVGLLQHLAQYTCPSPPGAAASTPGGTGAVQFTGVTTMYAIANPWSWPASFTVEARLFVRGGASDAHWLSYATANNQNCLTSREPMTTLQWITVHITYSGGVSRYLWRRNSVKAGEGKLCTCIIVHSAQFG